MLEAKLAVEIIFSEFESLIRTCIIQGLGRKQRLTQLVFLKTIFNKRTRVDMQRLSGFRELTGEAKTLEMSSNPVLLV